MVGETTKTINLEEINRCSKLVGVISGVEDEEQRDLLIGHATAYVQGIQQGIQVGYSTGYKAGKASKEGGSNGGK